MTCAGCQHKVGDECRRFPKQAVIHRQDANRFSDERAEWVYDTEWLFPPADERCGEFRAEATS